MTEQLVASTVSDEQPWPGLMPFTEDAHAFFHGREEEIAELLRLIKRETLTVLFGLSGLGKSSLLNAGLFPQLRREDFHPVYLRLDVLSATPLSQQAQETIRASCAAHHVEAPAVRAGDSLWEYFHRRDADFWSARNRILVPVLVFDQFEELFTLGRYRGSISQKVEAFIEELADLVEGRMPTRVEARLEEQRSQGDEYDFTRRSCKVVLSFREDYLPDFEALRGVIPSIMRSRLRLTRMNGAQARAAILESGGRLVPDEVCDRIIRFVASPRSVGANDEDWDAKRLEIEPALLSVVCRELNNKRIRAREQRISADLLEGGAQQQIIGEFYENSLADIDSRAREFIEDQLLTESGYRDSYALEDALLIPGVSRDAIETLIGRRLLRLDERAGVLRVELTHDVLTRVAKESRDARQQRETEGRAREIDAGRRARTRRFMIAGAMALALAIGLAAVFAVLLERSNEEKRRLIETQSNVLLEQAIAQLDRNTPGEPQAMLAEALRLNPANSAAVARIVTYATQHDFPRPLGHVTLAGMTDQRDLRLGWLDADRVALVGSAGVAVVNVREQLAARKSSRLFEARVSLGGSPGASSLAVPARIESVMRVPGAKALKIHTGRGDFLAELGGPMGEEDAQLMLREFDEASSNARFLSDDGQWIAFVQRNTVVAWNPARGALWRLNHSSPVNTLAFSPDSRILVTACQDKNARMWSLATGGLSGTPLAHEGAVLSVAFSANGQRLITGSLDRTARIWSVASGRQALESAIDSRPILDARLNPDASRAVTLAANGRMTVWQVRSDNADALDLASNVALLEASPDGLHVLAATGQRGPQPATLSISDAPRAGASAMKWNRLALLPGGEMPAMSQAVFSGDSRRVAIALMDAVEVRDAPTGELSGKRIRAPAATVLGLSGDGSRLATASGDEIALLWDVVDGTLRGLPMPHRDRVVKLAFSADGSLLSAIDAGGRVRIWDADSTLPVATIEPVSPGSRVAMAGFTHDPGGIVVVEEKFARLFALRPGNNRENAPYRPGLYTGALEAVEQARLTFLNTIWSADLCAASHRMVVGGIDGTARIVDLETFRLTGAPMKHDGVVLAARFASGGRWIVTRSEYAARVWDGRLGYAVADEVRHGARVTQAILVAGGELLLTQPAGENVIPHALDLDFPLPPAPWLGAFVEALGGSRLDKTGSVAPVENARGELDAVGRELATANATPWWKSWGERMLAKLGSDVVSGPLETKK